MTTLRLAAAALNQTPLDWTGNFARAIAAIRAAREDGAALVCLPELCLTGYGCEDGFFAPDTHARAWQMLEMIVPETEGSIVAVGLPVFHQRALFNTCALIANGRIIGLAAKRNLAGDGIHYEPRWFKPWPEGVRDDFTTPAGTTVPIGDLVFDLSGIRIGFEICEDAWVADRPGTDLAARGADIILNPSASHFAFGKAPVRRRFVAEGSRAFGAVYVYSNLLGNEAGRVIYDGQLLIAQSGNIVAESPRFSFRDFQILSHDVDLSLGRLAIARSASHHPRLPQSEDGGLIRANFLWPTAALNSRKHLLPPITDKCAEFTHAVSLALFDYLRKSHSSGYVVSLSGGADSAAVACLVRIMWELAAEELGADLAGKYQQKPFSEILLTAYQATENSGETTRNAAEKIAAALGATHRVLNLADIHSHYLDLISVAFGEPLTWEKHDIPLQNIQARLRSPGIWMLANLRNSILLTTSNRSEAAVGYATMDGDTSGGLAPVSGIDKAFLREWLRWLETTGLPIGERNFTVPELTLINRQQPTAELRPAEEGQTDEDDLMPYPILDFIERAAIRDRKSPKEILALIHAAFPEHAAETHRNWTRRFFTLWSRNQWKRERYAPGFHLDDENLDPKTWCRWPILSGGYEQELKEL